MPATPPLKPIAPDLPPTFHRQEGHYAKSGNGGYTGTPIVPANPPVRTVVDTPTHIMKTPNGACGGTFGY